MTGIETAAIVAAVATTASTVVGTISQMQQAKFQASVADMNAKIEAQNARRATERAFAEGQEQDRINAGIFGQQISEQSGSGLSAEGGTFALARKGARTLGRLDTLNVVQEGLLDAHNARVREANFRAEKSAAKASGRNALLSGAIGTVGSAAGAFGNLPTSLVGGSTSSIRTAGPRRFTFKG